MIDFSCIQQFVDAVQPEQQRAYQVYFDDINAKGGINGRRIVPVFKSYCPIDVATELTACTSLTDDNHVFAAYKAQNHLTPALNNLIKQQQKGAAFHNCAGFNQHPLFQ